MAMLTRWDPFRELSTIQDRMNRLFQDAYSPTREEGLSTATFAPPADVYEDENHVTLKLELPGIDEKDLDIRVENNTLIIKGERTFEKEEKEENFRRLERQYGTFVRSFALPSTVDTDNINANYDRGVLSISMPKRAEAKPKQIQVGIGRRAIEGKTGETRAGKAA
ncbi:MAG TPA: Hsp20/alpha crystallin family protein [Terriglobales bacterium]|jgi:HSP20 family protein|nr:Hsp20/alpha crystallin family protein [Terriglobales bacterium]